MGIDIVVKLLALDRIYGIAGSMLTGSSFKAITAVKHVFSITDLAIKIKNGPEVDVDKTFSGGNQEFPEF